MKLLAFIFEQSPYSSKSARQTSRQGVSKFRSRDASRLKNLKLEFIMLCKSSICLYTAQFLDNINPECGLDSQLEAIQTQVGCGSR